MFESKKLILLNDKKGQDLIEELIEFEALMIWISRVSGSRLNRHRNHHSRLNHRHRHRNHRNHRHRSRLNHHRNHERRYPRNVLTDSQLFEVSDLRTG